MKLPLVVERHPLDFDWPVSLSAMEKKPDTKSLSNLLDRFYDIKDEHGSLISKDEQGQASRPRHPSGPTIAMELAERLPVEEYESCVLQHFLVFDTRLCK